MAIRWDSESDWKNNQDSSGATGRNGELKQGYSRDMPPLSQDLVGYWPLHDNSAIDYSGNGNHGTLNGGVTTGVAGKGGLQAMNFDGNDDYILANSSTVDGETEASVMGWCKVKKDGTFGGIYGHQSNINSAGGGILIKKQNSDQNNAINVLLNGYDGGSNPTIKWTPPSDFWDEWNHVGVTWDGSKLRLYINSEVVASSDASSVSTLNDLGAFEIGRYEWADTGGVYYGNTDACDVRVYSRALSDAEVQTLYEWGKGDYVRPPNDGISYYKLDGDATDSWGSNDGTTEGGVAYSSNSIRNQSLDLDGSDDYVETKNFSALESNTFSISFWGYVKDQSKFNGAIVQRNSNNSGVFLGTDGDSNDPYFGIHDTNGNNHAITSGAGNWPENKWIHVAGIKTESGMKLFLNSNLEDNIQQSFTPLSTSSTTYIGANQSKTRAYFRGLIDDVRIYDRAISRREVHELYRWGTRGRDMRKFLVNH